MQRATTTGAKSWWEGGGGLEPLNPSGSATGATGKAWVFFWERRLLWFWHVKRSSDAVRTACDIKGDGRCGATGKASAPFWERRLLWFWHVKHSCDAVRTACDIKGDGRRGATGKASASFWERRLLWFWHVKQTSDAVRTVKGDGRRRPRRSKMTWKKLTKNNCH